MRSALGRRFEFFTVLRNRDYRKYYIGMLASVTGHLLQTGWINPIYRDIIPPGRHSQRIGRGDVTAIDFANSYMTWSGRDGGSISRTVHAASSTMWEMLPPSRRPSRFFVNADPVG